MSLEICYLSVFEKTIKLVVHRKASQYIVNKRNQLVEPILAYLFSFFKSELAKLDICSYMKWFIYDPSVDWCLITWQNLDESKFNGTGFVSSQ